METQSYRQKKRKTCSVTSNTFMMENGTETYGMSTMNDDQGTLLNNEQTVNDDYILLYRFVTE